MNLCSSTELTDQHKSYRTTNPNSTEVDLFTRSGSVADPLAWGLMTHPGKPSPAKAQRLIKLTYQVPPLKREDGAGRPPGPTAWSSN